MAKKTLQAVLLARRNDPRALRGAITIVGGVPRIVFGVVGDHRRFSVEVEGDDLKLVDDPRSEEPEPHVDSTAETEAPVDQPEAGAQKGRKPRSLK